MRKIETILACVDFSEYATMTLDYAVALAKGTDRKIIVFHVVNKRDFEGVQKISNYLPYTTPETEKAQAKSSGAESPVNYLPYNLVVEDYINTLTKDKMEKLERLLEDNYKNEKSMMQIKMDTGVPYECILNAIQTEDADLVVMANKGRGDVARILFGSAAEKVFRHSPVPVLSVRDKKKFKRQ
jgi:nucleotide-binding universal stress UspA family protein